VARAVLKEVLHQQQEVYHLVALEQVVEMEEQVAVQQTIIKAVAVVALVVFLVMVVLEEVLVLDQMVQAVLVAAEDLQTQDKDMVVVVLVFLLKVQAEPEVLKTLLVQEDREAQMEQDLLVDYTVAEEVPVMTIPRPQVVPVLKV
jgi:hypothetical protein